MGDPFNLQRFVEAQRPVIDRVLAELRAGQKRSHWMWCLPADQRARQQPDGAEVRHLLAGGSPAYLDHPVLGPRLRSCTELANAIEDRPIEEIFGYPDHLKFHSSMTLFARAALDNPVFSTALQKFFAGKLDPLTLERLA